MKRLLLIAAFAASPAIAQQPDAQLPSETACTAVRERVQLALAQADRGLQSDTQADVERWSAIAASYSTVYAAFCQGTADQ